MKVVQTVTNKIPYVTSEGEPIEVYYTHVSLFETDAGYYQAMEAVSPVEKLNEKMLQCVYDHGRRVTVKRAVELFGSSIAEKMDWSDE